VNGLGDECIHICCTQVVTREPNLGKTEKGGSAEFRRRAMSRIPVSTHSTSHQRTLQEPVLFPSERALSPVPPSRHNSAHSATMSSLSGHASSPGGKKSKRALGDEVSLKYHWLLSLGNVCTATWAGDTKLSLAIFSLRICISLRV
jgi:hypothetical protein